MQASPTAEEDQVTNSLDPSSPEVKVISVDAGGFYYAPNEIRVTKGETVRIVMTSKDMMSMDEPEWA